MSMFTSLETLEGSKDYGILLQPVAQKDPALLRADRAQKTLLTLRSFLRAA